MQQAVAAPNAPPLSPDERKLSSQFDAFFGHGESRRSEFSAAARTAHDAIVNRYLNYTGPTNWIHFTNIGHWDDRTLDRAATTEFLQLSNGIDTAAYYHTFSDAMDQPLDGRDPRGYVLTFPAGKLPDAERFWSITAYTPKTIELVPNIAKKYLVASYTPGLHRNVDGSLSVYMSSALPDGRPYRQLAASSGRPVQHRAPRLRASGGRSQQHLHPPGDQKALADGIASVVRQRKPTLCPFSWNPGGRGRNASGSRRLRCVGPTCRQAVRTAGVTGTVAKPISAQHNSATESAAPWSLEQHKVGRQD